MAKPSFGYSYGAIVCWLPACSLRPNESQVHSRYVGIACIVVFFERWTQATTNAMTVGKFISRFQQKCYRWRNTKFLWKRFVELNQSMPNQSRAKQTEPYLAMPCHFIRTQSPWHYYSSVWFNSVCLPCFCFWHWCQKQIISHHARIATQTHQTLFQNVACQIYSNPYHWKLLFRFLCSLARSLCYTISSAGTVYVVMSVFMWVYAFWILHTLLHTNTHFTVIVLYTHCVLCHWPHQNAYFVWVLPKI